MPKRIAIRRRYADGSIEEIEVSVSSEIRYEQGGKRFVREIEPHNDFSLLDFFSAHKKLHKELEREFEESPIPELHEIELSPTSTSTSLIKKQEPKTPSLRNIFKRTQRRRK